MKSISFVRSLRVTLAGMFFLLTGGVTFFFGRFLCQNFLDDARLLERQREEAVIESVHSALKTPFQNIERSLHLLEQALGRRANVNHALVQNLAPMLLAGSPSLRGMTVGGQGKYLHFMRVTLDSFLFWDCFFKHARKIEGVLLPKFLREKTVFCSQSTFEDKGARWMFYDGHGAVIYQVVLPVQSVKNSMNSEMKSAFKKAQASAPGRKIHTLGPQTFSFGGVGLTFVRFFLARAHLGDATDFAQSDSWFNSEATEKQQRPRFWAALHADMTSVQAILKSLATERVQRISVFNKAGVCVADSHKRRLFQISSDGVKGVHFFQMYPAIFSKHADRGKSKKEVSRQKNFYDLPRLAGYPLIKKKLFLRLFLGHGLHDAHSGLSFDGSVWDHRVGVVIKAPEDEQLLIRSLNQSYWLAFFLIAVSAVLIVGLLSWALAPLTRAAHVLSLAARMRFDLALPGRCFFAEIDQIHRNIGTMMTALKSFGRFVPTTLVRQMLDQGQEAKSGGSLKEITLFFSDIQNFTTLAEGMTPDALTQHLSVYFQSMTDVILQNGGTVDKYIGDAVMAFWGAPLHDPVHAEHAAKTALQLQDVLAHLNQNWAKAGKSALNTRMGLATGCVTVGNMGSHDRLQYTALGDVVNLAARLEGLNKVYGTKILISEETANQIKSSVVNRVVDRVAVKGKKRSVLIFTPLGLKEDIEGLGDTAALQLKKLSCEAFSFYEQGQFHSAERLYRLILHLFPGDTIALCFLERCVRFINCAPAQWDGIWRFQTK